jgi:predicted Zn-dependent protease with MMP-like domain
MFKVSTEEFENLVKQAVESLPKTHRERLHNIGFFVRKNPSKKQAEKARLQPGMSLLGLYEGVPLAARNGLTTMMPDTVTIFQEPLEQQSSSLKELNQNIKHTVWHEVAHYFGLDHKRIREIEKTFES